MDKMGNDLIGISIFVILVIAIYQFTGSKATEYFLYLVIGSILVYNSDKLNLTSFLQ